MLLSSPERNGSLYSINNRNNFFWDRWSDRQIRRLLPTIKELEYVIPRKYHHRNHKLPYICGFLYEKKWYVDEHKL